MILRDLLKRYGGLDRSFARCFRGGDAEVMVTRAFLKWLLAFRKSHPRYIAFVACFCSMHDSVHGDSSRRRGCDLHAENL